MSIKKMLVLLGALIVAAVIFTACAGPAGPEGPAGPAGPEGPAGPAAVAEVSLQPETCGICHPDAGANHQASYDELYQDTVIEVSDLTYRFTEPGTTVVSFKMTKNGAPINGGAVQNLNVYFAPYTEGKFQFDPAAERLSLKGKLSYDPASGVTTSTLEELDPTADGYFDYTNVSGVDGIIIVYGYDKQVGSLPARIKQVQYPYAGVLETGAGVDYLSAANNDGCEKCHTDPYLKHGNIYGQINGDPGTDFLACKVCHLDNGEGGHFEWQLLVDDPALAAAYLAGEVELTAEQQEQYAYATSLKNDVHMSHAMEFPYPQSMSNCVTCHEGKLDVILSDANFKAETCKSCHALNGSVAEGEEPAYDTTGLALATILPEGHDLTSDCASCHKADGVAPVFSKIHTGYNNVIFTADGEKYSDIFTVSIDEASLADNVLTIKFSAAKNAEVTDLEPADIIPTVMVGLYGYDTKDFIVSPHSRDADNNRLLEFQIAEGVTNPRFTVVSAAGGSWEVTADLSEWADMMADGTVKRAEIAVMPLLAQVVGEIDSHENGETDDTAFAVNAPSRTFDLGANDFDDGFYSPIVKVEDGCNNCHEALATTFHSPDRGGNIVVCRMCHVTTSGGSHLELQSRSIDSYAHAIHSFQPFDVGDINFDDPVEALEFGHHIEFPYPTHGSTNCESCHVAGAYNVPDQAKSMPGLLSASDVLTGRDRNIGDVPSYVTGPATRACGGCHRAAALNEDSAGELAMLFRHWTDGGYMVEAGEDASGTLQSVIDEIMALFK
jgi:OmcA/MtrC family decaheme c-type cytochrome